MNNTVEKWIFGFHKVQWLQYTGEVPNVQAADVKFPQDLTHQKSLKSVNFWQIYLKNKKVDFFGTQCIIIFSSGDPLTGETLVGRGAASVWEGTVWGGAQMFRENTLSARWLIGWLAGWLVGV